MGFGLGAAIGAKLARKHDRVVLITGDGSFHMNCNELATVAKYNLPITVIVMNNGVLGMVRQWQWVFFGGRFSQTEPERNTDFVMLARAFGVEGMRITNLRHLVKRLNAALNSDMPIVVDCVIPSNAAVMPMIPPGGTVRIRFKKKNALRGDYIMATIQDAKRIVVKVGTSTLTYETGKTNIRRMASLAAVLSDLQNAGHEVVLVTSGAIGIGVGKLGLKKRPDDTAGKQAAATVGQCELMFMYDKLFGELWAYYRSTAHYPEVI